MHDLVSMRLMARVGHLSGLTDKRPRPEKVRRKGHHTVPY